MRRRRETAIVLSTEEGTSLAKQYRQEVVLLLISKTVLIAGILRFFHSFWYIASNKAPGDIPSARFPKPRFPYEPKTVIFRNVRVAILSSALASGLQTLQCNVACFTQIVNYLKYHSVFKK